MTAGQWCQVGLAVGVVSTLVVEHLWLPWIRRHLRTRAASNPAYPADESAPAERELPGADRTGRGSM